MRDQWLSCTFTALSTYRSALINSCDGLAPTDFVSVLIRFYYSPLDECHKQKIFHLYFQTTNSDISHPLHCYCTTTPQPLQSPSITSNHLSAMYVPRNSTHHPLSHLHIPAISFPHEPQMVIPRNKHHHRPNPPGFDLLYISDSSPLLSHLSVFGTCHEKRQFLREWAEKIDDRTRRMKSSKEGLGIGSSEFSLKRIVCCI